MHRVSGSQPSTIDRCVPQAPSSGDPGVGLVVSAVDAERDNAVPLDYGQPVMTIAMVRPHGNECVLTRDVLTKAVTVHQQRTPRTCPLAAPTQANSVLVEFDDG
jgi:hypothetical protein